MNRPQTLGALKAAHYRVDSVKDEMRRNLIAKLRAGERLFPGIIGYDDTVIPGIVNAILAKHDILLLGLRGQAKSRIVRMLPLLLDEWVPIVKGSEINDNPFRPVSKYAVDKVSAEGDDTEIEWIHRDQRFSEKLATPDVTIADLIGDVDPIKAATQRLHFAHEGAIHYGLIPRSNRGIFAINELPDLQPRIQVGLFNIMEEKDVQIRGFNIRIPLDVVLVFTANPEDYTNRGNIITPLKDRIDSQILTHYPRTLEDAMAITEQEAWIRRDGRQVLLPKIFREIVENIAFEARKSDYVDQKSGVSARLTIAVMENMISNAERRALLLNESAVMPRICDLQASLPGMTGKVELVFEGEQEGPLKVSKALVGKAVREVFLTYFPNPLRKPRPRQADQARAPEDPYREIIQWFEEGNTVAIGDETPCDEYIKALKSVRGLEAVTKRYLPKEKVASQEFAAAMEFVLDALHQCSRIAKEETLGTASYKDLVGTIFRPKEEENEEEA